ncbi:metalloendoproteinase 2-MMP-like [Macadamia integrifolia]|uniref:metalloendoproteinase 2-MMP-like n=1 Tax=Macadamia integrifolia TaxID=60698 RepID=UPI001C4E5232|nr:metalloendoproteinase 2-MMP-like [Macadamia integrifolia]
MKFSLLFCSSILLLSLFILPQIVLSRPVKQPFKSFLQHLEGCHKGQTVKGLYQLKQYLQKFGYLSYPQSNKSLAAHANDDEFDDLLEAALKTYQLNYNLKVTGAIDLQTVKQLMVPRCGVSDIINGTSSMRSGKRGHHHGSNTLHTISHYSFFTNMPKWPASKSHLKYYFHSSAQISAVQDLQSVCSKALSRWAQVSHFTFEEVAEGTSDADIVIGFHRGDHGDGYPFDGQGSTLAHAFSPTDGRFHYDADENWSTNPSQNMMDLESVAVHEIGHLPGLGHSSVQDAIMYAYISSGVEKRDLHSDDIAGIQYLYGSS